MLGEYVPVLITLVVAMGLAATFMLLATILGPKRRLRVKMEPFECGVEQVASPRRRFSVKFYLVAMLFILFDIEVVFLYPLAIPFRAMGWFGFVAMTIFLGVVFITLAYEWRKGALDWE
ncbi:MAG: NADH-quinone oxidoreductase subunit A [Myxococcota bacterium]